MEKAYSQIAISPAAEEHMRKDPEIIQLQHERLTSELGRFLLKEGYIFIEKSKHIPELDHYIMRASIIPASEEEYREYKMMKTFLDSNANIENEYRIWKERTEIARRSRNEEFYGY